VDGLVDVAKSSTHARADFCNAAKRRLVVAKLEAQGASMPAAKLNVLWPATKN